MSNKIEASTSRARRTCMCVSRRWRRSSTTSRVASVSTSWPSGRPRSAGRRGRWLSSTRYGTLGEDAEGRDGFQGWSPRWAGQVGIVLGIEVSRLARGNADWYQLLDLCALTDTLIPDDDGIYHPGCTTTGWCSG